MSATLELTKELISRPSVTPEDKGCQQLLAEHLANLGFCIEHLRFEDVDNLWARRGDAEPLLVFAGHTDVVPSGPLDAWRFPPFEPTVANGMLYGRGAADMKGGIAAMITACGAFFAKYPKTKASMAFLITSDEEGPGINGTRKVMETLQARHEKITWCLVGEPSSDKEIADQVKNGRRGSLNGHLVVHGVQGHVAYPHLAQNPLHLFAPALQDLCAEEWDQGNAFFPPTGFQISNIHAGTGAGNIIPGTLDVHFNFRYSSELNDVQIKQRVHALLDKHKLNYTLDWEHSGPPFLTPEGELLEAAQAAVSEVCGRPPRLSTSGGTSDGRIIAPYGVQVLELGLLNATIHKVNECTPVEDLDVLSRVYYSILEKLLL